VIVHATVHSQQQQHSADSSDVSTQYKRKNCRRSRIEVRPTALPRPHALNCAAAAGFDRATPPVSPRYLASDGFTMETHYYGH